MGRERCRWAERLPTPSGQVRPEKIAIIMKGGLFSALMGSYITTFSVPDESKMARKLRRWKKDGVNISCRLQDLLNDDLEPLEAQIEALRRKLWYSAFKMYYPRKGFSRALSESVVTEILGFQYTKKATTKRAIEYGWDSE